MHTSERPISPHLTVYKPQISSVLSIMHRLSGIFNFLGMACFLWWILLIAYPTAADLQNNIWDFFGSILGKTLLIAWTFSLYFHFCTGLRHLMWDFGYGFEVKTMNFTGWLAIILAITLTVSTWIIIFKLV